SNIDTSIEKIFNQVYNMVSDLVEEKELEIVFDIDSKIPDNIHADELRIEQILVNFANNAVKFTKTGLIKIKARLQEINEQTLTIHFSVVDPGVGISKEKQQKLFSAFEQADNSITRKYGGTGLGLAISKRLVGLMKGEIGVESEPGKGSIFWFTGQYKLAQTALNSEIKEIKITNKKILVVDDLADVREIHQSMLQSMNFQVDLANNGNHAITLVEKSIKENKPYDFIMMDWLMPGLNGLDATKAIKQLKHSIEPKYILVTAYNQIKLEDYNGQKCFNAILNKPISPSQFYDVLVDFDETRLSDIKNNDTLTPFWDEQIAPILLVEDNITNQELMLDMLTHVGLNVVIADNGRKALSELEKIVPSLILMDIQMPIMDGIEATENIRKQESFNSIPIIALTANAFSEEKQRCLDAGMNAHLSKPVEPEIFYNMLKQWLPKADNQLMLAGGNSKTCPQYLLRIKEIDAKTALTYFRDDCEKYVSQLRRYCQEQAEDAIVLDALIKSDVDISEAIRSAHTLKCLAETLGIKKVFELSKEIESTLKKDGDVTTLIKQLKKVNSDTVTSIKSSLPAKDIEAIQINANEIEKEAFAALSELKELLEEDSYETIDCFDKHEQLLRAFYGAEITPLARHVSKYENEEALDEAVKLLADKG
ncbi:MAG: response regulator, partial [Gammaproteobacteria bacterium]|nr:response regulator [Gammaproteobacteria bacterium]